MARKQISNVCKHYLVPTITVNVGENFRLTPCIYNANELKYFGKIQSRLIFRFGDSCPCLRVFFYYDHNTFRRNYQQSAQKITNNRKESKRTEKEIPTR